MTYQGKSYEELLKEAQDDEAQAGNMYRNMAEVAPGTWAANILKSIAADEDRHYSLVTHLLNVLSMSPQEEMRYTERMEAALGHRHPGQVERPFPRTYSDWVDLAEDIKGAIGATPAGWDAINHQLQIIATGEGNVDEAKRWLVQKAGELGIR